MKMISKGFLPFFLMSTTVFASSYAPGYLDSLQARCPTQLQSYRGMAQYCPSTGEGLPNFSYTGTVPIERLPLRQTQLDPYFTRLNGTATPIQQSGLPDAARFKFGKERPIYRAPAVLPNGMPAYRGLEI